MSTAPLQPFRVDPTCTGKSGTTRGTTTTCWHHVWGVSGGGKEDEDWGMMDAIAIMKLYVKNRVVKDEMRNHFEGFKALIKGDSKPRHKYKIIPKEEKLQIKKEKMIKKEEEGEEEEEKEDGDMKPPAQKRLKAADRAIAVLKEEEDDDGADSDKENRDPNTPTSATAAASKKPDGGFFVKPQAVIIKKKPKTLSKLKVRSGDIGGVRRIGSVNKRKRREFKAPADKSGYEFREQNYVVKNTAWPGIPLNLIKEFFRGRNEPKKFPTVTVELDDPQCAVSYSSSGEESCAGTKGRSTALLAFHLLHLRLAKLFKIPYIIQNAGPVNIACSLRFPLAKERKKFHLYKFARDHEKYGATVIYDPDNFKGLQWHLLKYTWVVIMFSGGAVNVVGLETPADVEKAKNQVVSYLKRVAHKYIVDEDADTSQPLPPLDENEEAAEEEEDNKMSAEKQARYINLAPTIIQEPTADDIISENSTLNSSNLI